MSRKQEVLDTLVQACLEAYEREGTKGLWAYVDCDEKAVRYAPVTGRVSYILGCPDREARYHLQALHVAGKVLREPRGNAQGSAVRWWPVGMWPQLTSDA